MTVAALALGSTATTDFGCVNMKKINVRHLMSHWDSVWHHYRHRTELLPTDQMIVKAINPGNTLAWNCLGFRYQTRVPKLTVYEDMMELTPNLSEQFDNILALNVFQIRYSTIIEYAETLANLCQYLRSNGRLIFGVNSIFINWNRTAQTLPEALDELILLMKNDHGMSLTHKIVHEFQTDAVKGDCFFIFDKRP
jgi:hypothetical protein